MQLLKNEIEGVCLCDTFKNLDIGVKWDFEKLYFNVYFRGGEGDEKQGYFHGK